MLIRLRDFQILPITEENEQKSMETARAFPCLRVDKG